MTGHKRQELLERIQEYAKSFTPEWNFYPEQQDAGAALGLRSEERRVGKEV